MCKTVSIFFFSSRRRHTRFDCDWSSDVCSSDLGGRAARAVRGGGRDRLVPGPQEEHGAPGGRNGGRSGAAGRPEIGRAAWRERGEISVVAVSLKKKKTPDHATRCHLQDMLMSQA